MLDPLWRRVAREGQNHGLIGIRSEDGTERLAQYWIRSPILPGHFVGVGVPLYVAATGRQPPAEAITELLAARSLEGLGDTLARNAPRLLAGARSLSLLVGERASANLLARGRRRPLLGWGRIPLPGPHPCAFSVRREVPVYLPLALVPGPDGRPAGQAGWLGVIPLQLGRRRRGCLVAVLERDDPGTLAALRGLGHVLDGAVAHVEQVERTRQRAQASAARLHRLEAMDQVAALVSAPAERRPEHLQAVVRAVAGALGGRCVLDLPDRQGRGLLHHSAWHRRSGGRPVEPEPGRTPPAAPAKVRPARPAPQTEVEAEADRFRAGVLAPHLRGLGAEVRALLAGVERGGVALLPLHPGGPDQGRLVVVRPERGFASGERAFLRLVRQRLGDTLQLLQAADQSMAAICSRDEFLALAAHEMDGPLASAALLATAAEAGLDPALSGPRALLRGSRQQIEVSMALIRQLADVARRRREAVLPQRKAMDLGQAVRTAVEAVEMARACKGRIQLHLPEQPVAGHWDPVQMEQLIRNLVSNAIKFGEGKAVDVYLRLARAGGVRLSVRDRGIGIAAADRQRIFERFVRAAPRRQYSGLGLGLWLVREIVKGHDGRIEVHSRPGRGSLFEVWLPTGGGATRAA